VSQGMAESALEALMVIGVMPDSPIMIQAILDVIRHDDGMMLVLVSVLLTR